MSNGKKDSQETNKKIMERLEYFNKQQEDERKRNKKEDRGAEK